MIPAKRLEQAKDFETRILDIEYRHQREHERMSERLASLRFEATRKVKEAEIELAQSQAHHMDPHPELRLVRGGDLPRGA